MPSERPAKRVKLLAASDDESSDDDASSASDSNTGGVKLPLTVNKEYARRFEHNQARAERQRLEEKYGKDAVDDEDESDSEDEDEDDEAELANGALDEQFQETLQALRKKDPRIYKTDVKFYDEEDEDGANGQSNGSAKEKKDKPMYLADYHKQNLLNGNAAGDEDEDETRRTFAQEQEAMRKSVIKSMHANDDEDEDSDDDEGGFLVKSRVEAPEPAVKSATSTKVAAKDDPDAFLDDFLSRRAWVPTTSSKVHAFESDDEEFDMQAEEFEHAYNLRFEDPDANKGKLVSHARDIAAKYSVRQDDANKRQRARDVEKSKREQEKATRHEEKARLKKLKLDEAEEKLRKLKETSGLRGKEFNMDEWSKFLTGDWDDAQWQKEFEKKFGDDYYAEKDDMSSDADEADEGAADGKKRKRKPKKPKFDDDIDIDDLVPEWEDDEAVKFTITDDEDEAEDENVESDNAKKPKKSKDRKKDREEAKRDAKRERRKLEALVNEQVDADAAMDEVIGKKRSNAGPTKFRYRETSPTTFGLTANEILMASDAQLNSFVGLKKMATFRDENAKRKDKKHLGKKARLRQWRKDTFGNEQGPTRTLQDVLKESEN